MRLQQGFMGGVALFGLILPHMAMAADAEDEAERARASRGEIVVIGKSYGAEVGKTITPLKDIPNTVTVIDREQIEAQGLFTLEDVMTVTNGITVTGVGSEGPAYMSRGFEIDNYLVDGVATKAFGSPAVVPDTFFYDRVEVLRGPAGLFSGSGNPAGSINLVRKRPLDEFKVQAMAGYGSYDNKRFELDVSAPLTDIGGVRAGVLVHDQDQFFDVGHRNRLAAFVVGSVDIGPQTTLTFGGSYDRFKPAIQSGLPGIRGGDDGSDGRLLDISRKTYVGADWNRFRSDIWSGFIELAHKFSEDWTLRATGTVTDVKRIDIYSYIGAQPVTETNGVTNHIAYRGDNKMWSKAFDVNVIGSFEALGQTHSLIFGGDYQGTSGSGYSTRKNNYASIDIYNPVYPAEPDLNPYVQLPNFTNVSGVSVAPTYGGSRSWFDQYGVYGQLRLVPVEGLTLTGGGRFSWWETKSQTVLPNVGAETVTKVNGRFTPYGGIVWDVTPGWNLYASYADSFSAPPTSNRQRTDGQALKPLIGAQYEAGTKLSLFDDHLLLSLAAYQITQTNRLFNDPDLPDIVHQIGKVRSRGIEFDIGGQILPGWRVNGGYAYNKNKYLEDANPLLEGIPLVPIVPEHSIKAFTNYAPENGPLAGFSIGGSLTWFTSTYGGSPATFNADGTVARNPSTGALLVSTIVRQDAYVVADARAGYKFNERVSVAVNLNNLFDKKYYSRISSTTRGNYFGSPRTVFATLRIAYP